MASPNRKAILLVLALWAAGLGGAAQFAKMAVILPHLQAHYGETGVASGFLVSLISLIGIVFGLVAGLLALRIGLRRLLVAGLLVGGLMSLLQASMPAFEWMLVTRFVEGLSHLAIVVAAPTLIAQIAPAKQQGAALTLWGTFFGVAFALITLAAPPLMAAGGPPSLFIAHGIYMLAFTALMIVILPKPPDNAKQARWPTPTGIIAQHRAIYASPFVGAPALGWVFYTLSFVSVLAVVPPFIAPEDRLFATAWMPIASIASSMIIGVFLLRFVSAVTVVIIGFAASSVFTVGLLLVGADAWLCILLFAALGLVQGASFATVPQLNEGAAERGQANGGLAQTGNLGNTFGTPIMLGIVSVTGFVGLPLFLLVCFAAGIATHLWLARRRRAML